MEFGRDYIIPKPFDPRVLIWVASAVAQAAMESGVAQVPVDIEEYQRAAAAPPGQGARSHARDDPQGAARAQARGLPRGRGGQDPARLPDSGRREDRRAHPAGQRGEDPAKRSRSCICTWTASRSWTRRSLPLLAAYAEEFYRLRHRKGVTRSEAGRDDAEPQHVRRHDGAHGRRRRADRRADRALSRTPSGRRCRSSTCAPGCAGSPASTC